MMLHGCIIVPLFLCSTKLGMEPKCSSNGCQTNLTFKQLLIIYERAGSCVTCTQSAFKEMHPHNMGVMGSGRCPEKSENARPEWELLQIPHLSHWWTHIRGRFACSGLRTSENHAVMVYYTTEIVWKSKGERFFLTSCFLSMWKW